MKYIFLCFLLILLLSCKESGNNISVMAQFWNGGDITAPIIENIQAINSKKYVITFNEFIANNSPTITIDGNIYIDTIQIQDNKLSFLLSSNTLAGQKYTFSTLVQDTVGNSLLIVDSIYGFNALIPQIVISEFLCEGSKTRPDKTELFVKSDGNLAGITLQEGGFTSFKQRVIFPNIDVKAGDFIVVHWRPDTQHVFHNESKSKNESTHPQSYKNAWDIFSTHDKGISNTNGSLSLLSSPQGGVMLDAVIFSTKQDDVTHKYKGFAKQDTFMWATEITKHTMWNIKHSHTSIMPSDTINPKDSTTTRSISRDSQYTDTNSASDWHITPNRGSTFGETNTNDVYTTSH